MEPDWQTGARDSYDRVAEAYAALVERRGPDDPYMRATYATFGELARLAASPRRGRVIDVGCGPGLWTQYLASLGLDAIGIDLSPAMIAHADRCTGRARFAVGSILDLPLPDGEADAVACMYVLHHLPDGDIDRAVEELIRVLRPGGVLLIGGHVGDRRSVKTEGYGGIPMRVHVIRRPAAAWEQQLLRRNLEIEAHTIVQPHADGASHALFARK